jgi:hypothetical protein
MGYWPEGDLGDDCDGDIAGYDGPQETVNMTLESCTPHGCQCACHNPMAGMHVSHVVPCCFAAAMTVETKTEWHCEECLAVFTDEESAWAHWMKTGGSTQQNAR